MCLGFHLKWEELSIIFDDMGDRGGGWGRGCSPECYYTHEANIGLIELGIVV